LLAVGALLLGLYFIVRRAGAASQTGRAQATATPAPRRAKPSVGAERQDPVFATHTAHVPPSTSSEPTRQRDVAWSPAVLAAIEWRRFEALCEAFYAQAGLATRSQSHGADGGVDIWLQSRHMDAPRIVQCKHWLNRPVGVKEMREFRGVMASHQLASGTYVTSSTFTADATTFAKANGIQLQDGAALLKLIGQRTPEQQSALLAVAYEGEYWRPTCASCGTKMVERRSGKEDARVFWGCANYPRCRGTTIAKARDAAT
jgi:restriction system protein